MTEENRKDIPDTIDGLLGRLKKRRIIFKSFSSREELEAWHNQEVVWDLERLDKARTEGRTETLHIELPKVDVDKIRLWINETGKFESVDDFMRRTIWNELDNLPWEDLRQK